jgi:hypothetical protein
MELPDYSDPTCSRAAAVTKHHHNAVVVMTVDRAARHEKRWYFTRKETHFKPDS